MTAIVVTGATGYIGRRLAAAALKRGWQVTAASRSDPGDPELAWISYHLEAPPDASAFPVGAAIVHLAADTRSGDAIDAGTEVAAVERLLTIARERASRVVFVSTQAARADAPSAYGRVKWQCEQRVLAAGGIVVRPGMVYGGPPGGLYGKLLEEVRRARVLPALLPPPRVQPIHVDDLAQGLLRIVERNDASARAYNLMSPAPVTFAGFLRAIAGQRLRCRRTFAPVPAALLGLALSAARRLLGGRHDPARLRSLMELPMLESAQDLSALGLALRPLESGLHPSGSGRRRSLIREGRALVTYVLGERAPRALLRRYVRAIEALRDGEPVRLPSIALASPRWIAALDGAAWLRAANAQELLWRIDAAVAIAEASPAGARRFVMSAGTAGKPRAAAALAGAVLGEAFWRTVRVIASPVLRRSLAQRPDG